MDKSSRNIVTFIATITAAALLIMAARYYAQSNQTEPVPAAEAAPKPVVSPSTGLAVDDLTGETDKGGESEEPEVIEEDYEIEMGRPSVEIGQPSQANPDAPSVPPPPYVSSTEPVAAPPPTQ